MQVGGSTLQLPSVGIVAVPAAVLDRPTHVEVGHPLRSLFHNKTHAEFALTASINPHTLTWARQVAQTKVFGCLDKFLIVLSVVVLLFFNVIWAVDLALKIFVLLLDLLLVGIVARALLTTHVVHVV